jgi:eukaryotic-like serine/threonine-protein kinase
VILLSPAFGGESGLVRVSASGGAISPVTRLEPVHGETNHVWPHFLPDGRHFLFNIMGRDNPGIYVGSLDSPDRTQLLKFDLTDPNDVGLSTLAYAAPGYVLYVRGQTLMAQPIDLGNFRFSGPAVPVADGVEKVGPGSAAFTVSGTGVLAYWAGTGVQSSQLTWRARDGTMISRIGAQEGYTGVALAPDDRRIAVSRVDPGKQSAIWVLDVARGTAQRVSFDPVSTGAVWSPDGAAIAYASAKDGPPSLFQKAVSGSGQDALLFKSHRSNVPTDWCAAVGGQAAGRTIIFVTNDEKTQSDIWMLPPTGEQKPVPLLQTAFNEDEARCSPDGRWLAYSSDESGRHEIYATSFPKPSGKWPVSSGGGTQPRWRHDGTELFYLAPDRTVTSVRVGAGSTFEVGAATPLFQIRGTSYAPSADGRRFVTNDPIGEPSAQPITVVLNWTAGLRK